ncbi:MAG: site-specific integrase, partial [Bacteroidetes bacterium]
MSFVDIAYLKVSNIHGDRLTYDRQKTKRKFSIKLTDRAKEIVTRYNNLKNKKCYIFRKGQEYLDYRNAMRLMNKKLKDLGDLAELDEPL